MEINLSFNKGIGWGGGERENRDETLGWLTWSKFLFCNLVYITEL